MLLLRGRITTLALFAAHTLFSKCWRPPLGSGPVGRPIAGRNLLRPRSGLDYRRYYFSRKIAAIGKQSDDYFSVLASVPGDSKSVERVHLCSRAYESTGRTARDPACVHFRTLAEEEFDEVGAVLAGCTGDEGNLAGAVAGRGVHLAGLVLSGVASHLDGGGDGNVHGFVCFVLI